MQKRVMDRGFLSSDGFCFWWSEGLNRMQDAAGSTNKKLEAQLQSRSRAPSNQLAMAVLLPWNNLSAVYSRPENVWFGHVSVAGVGFCWMTPPCQWKSSRLCWLCQSKWEKTIFGLWVLTTSCNQQHRTAASLHRYGCNRYPVTTSESFSDLHPGIGRLHILDVCSPGFLACHQPGQEGWWIGFSLLAGLCWPLLRQGGRWVSCEHLPTHKRTLWSLLHIFK